MLALQTTSSDACAADVRIIAGQADYPEYPGPLSLDALIEEVERRRDEFDAVSHVPRDMVAKMKRAGIFRASTPRRFGGDAPSPLRSKPPSPADMLQGTENPRPAASSSLPERHAALAPSRHALNPSADLSDHSRVRIS